jgi:phosphoribosyl 1,2-cyclic phosphodiesterase
MPINVCVLGSGSKGNCTAVWTANTVIVIDAGRLAMRYIRASLEHAGLSFDRINGVLITHSHTDHFSDTTYRLCHPNGIPVYCSSPTWKSALRRKSNRRLEELEKRGLRRPLPDDLFRIGDFVVEPFPISHSHRSSAGAPVGYTLHAKGHKVAYATDLGCVIPAIEEKLTGADILVIESNHDVEMERRSGRPSDTIDWVLGDTGHLSNKQCASALGNVVARAGRRPRHIVLAHISEECNQPKLALSTAAHALSEGGAPQVNLIAARQRTPTPVVSV